MSHFIGTVTFFGKKHQELYTEPLEAFFGHQEPPSLESLKHYVYRQFKSTANFDNSTEDTSKAIQNAEKAALMNMALLKHLHSIKEIQVNKTSRTQVQREEEESDNEARVLENKEMMNYAFFVFERPNSFIYAAVDQIANSYQQMEVQKKYVEEKGHHTWLRRVTRTASCNIRCHTLPLPSLNMRVVASQAIHMIQDVNTLPQLKLEHSSSRELTRMANQSQQDPLTLCVPNIRAHRQARKCRNVIASLVGIRLY
jgi:hypothetical protein